MRENVTGPLFADAEEAADYLRRTLRTAEEIIDGLLARYQDGGGRALYIGDALAAVDQLVESRFHGEA